ncbi:MAG: alanine racemase [Patescibacteria group bacterium]
MSLYSWLRNLKREFETEYSPLIVVEVSKHNLLHNAETYSDILGLPLSPVLKSNAYGHGILGVGKIFDTWGKAPFLSVDSLYEALFLQKNGIRTPLLVLGYVPAVNIFRKKLKNIGITIVSMEQLREISGMARFSTSLHLKIDTGMRRQGILPSDVPEALRLVKGNQYLLLEGLCSHFADADNEEASDFTDRQIEEWNEVAERLQKEIPTLKHFHISATSGIFHRKKIKKSTVARIGLGMYGIHTNAHDPEGLLPALSLKSVISGTKTLRMGEFCGYGCDFEALKDMTIATVPAGYFEGIDRRLGNKGTITLRGKDCSLIGRISMNISTIDVSSVEEVKIGEEVVIISDKSEEKNSVENIAKICDTIPYEILVHIPSHLRRIYR